MDKEPAAAVTPSAARAVAAVPIESAPRRQLTLFDSTCIIVGIIIGSFIYKMSPTIAGSAPHVWGVMGFWVLGGLLSLIGALCYAELATAYPQEGGDYIYLTRAFGRKLGFLFAWAQLWVVRPGSIGAVAYVFATYANELLPLGDGKHVPMIYAAGSIAVLTLINVLGVRAGKTTQNVLTILKVLGLLAIFAVGMLFRSHLPTASAAVSSAGWDVRFAMIMIFLAYGGWNEMAYVAAEVRDPQRNILRSLLLGTAAVTVIYLLVNIAFIHALGFSDMRKSEAVASDVLKLAGGWGGAAISSLICVSTLGAINGMIFTGSRITYAMGSEHRLYAFLGQWNSRRGTPMWSLIIQGLVTIGLVVGFGWTKNGFEAMVIFETPIFWLFFLMVGVSLFVLRWREPNTPRPYRTPAYPVVPVLFCLSSLFMVYASISYAVEKRSWEVAWSVGILAVGVALSFFSGPALAKGRGFEVKLPAKE